MFVGNVPSDVITSKTTAKNFKKLFKEFGKIDSIRFRSISFGESLPRKVSFAKSLHESRDSVNAYVVFAEKLASLAAKKLNATVLKIIIFELIMLPTQHQRIIRELYSLVIWILKKKRKVCGLTSMAN